MPPVSEAQRRAMRAAASGNSTLGIPQSVGEEFSAADTGGKLPKRSKTRKRSASKTRGASSSSASRTRGGSKRSKKPKKSNYDYMSRY